MKGTTLEMVIFSEDNKSLSEMQSSPEINSSEQQSERSPQKKRKLSKVKEKVFSECDNSDGPACR